jgi:hypothetical protein
MVLKERWFSFTKTALMLDDAWEVRCDVNGQKDDCQA